MAYDAAKAHEYYMQYRKKGLKKDRKKNKKKATAKKGKQTNLVGLSSAGLNDSGKMQAAMIKENLKKEMNAALGKETDPAKREAIRQEYQNKALSEISNLKNDPQYAKAKAAKSGKSSGSKGGSSKGDDAKKSADKKKSKKKKAAIKKLKTDINNMKSMISNLSPAQKQAMQTTLQGMLKRLKALRG